MQCLEREKIRAYLNAFCNDLLNIFNAPSDAVVMILYIYKKDYNLLLY